MKQKRAATAGGVTASPDKLETLRDTNKRLKKKKIDLETEVRVISTQVTRMVEQLKSDKIMKGRSAQFEKELDGLIEENIRLSDTRLDLMKKVSVA